MRVTALPWDISGSTCRTKRRADGGPAHRFGFLAVVEELEADARPPAELVGCQAAAGLARKLNIGLGRRNLLKILRNQCGPGFSSSLVTEGFYHVIETVAIVEMLKKAGLNLQQKEIRKNEKKGRDGGPPH